MDNKLRDLKLEKQIDAYIKGNLSEEEDQELWAELLKKPEYIEFLNIELAAKAIYEDETTSTIRIKNDTTGGQGSPRQGFWKWMAAAAAIVLLIVAIYILQVDTTQNLQKSAIQEINIVENLASAQVARSQAANLSKGDSLLNAGFSAAIADSNTQAIKIYDQVINNFSDQLIAVQAHLNKGIIQYNAGDLTGATGSFSAVVSAPKGRANDAIKEKAYWYLGNAYLKIEKVKQARKAIAKVDTMDGDYREKAQKLLTKIDQRLSQVGDDMDSQAKE